MAGPRGAPRRPTSGTKGIQGPDGILAEHTCTDRLLVKMMKMFCTSWNFAPTFHAKSPQSPSLPLGPHKGH